MLAARGRVTRANPSGVPMPIPASSLPVGHCYATALDEVRKIVELDRNLLSYVVRGKLAFPAWDKKLWRSASREVFAREVTREVPCDWRPD
jgi:hypothetical protein